jgi:hypothetical protein
MYIFLNAKGISIFSRLHFRPDKSHSSSAIALLNPSLALGFLDATALGEHPQHFAKQCWKDSVA